MLFSQKIKKLREDKGLTQAELARLCGVKRQYITSIEKGRQLPSKKLQYAIAKHLGIKIPFLHKLCNEAKLELKIANLGFREPEMIQFVKELLIQSTQQRQTVIYNYNRLKKRVNI